MSISQSKINAIRLVGGVSVLDFLNTCDGRRPGTALTEVVDKLSSLEDILNWYLHAALISAQEYQSFLTLVDAQPWQQTTVFQQVVGFRESLYALLLPVALGKAVDAQQLAVLNAQLADTAVHRLLVSTPTGVMWCWRVSDSLQAMTASLIGRVAVQAASLLTGPDVSRLKACATPNCDWLFLDTSKNGRRRWCQMNICGSREKARRLVG
jgi:predicted RNA-binding Zn ribbon-like protein